MRVLSWNLCKRADRAEGIGAALLEAQPDLVLLQSVTLPLFEGLRRFLSQLGFAATASSIDDARSAGKHAANVIAGRWPLLRMPSGWAGGGAPQRGWVQRYNRLRRELVPWTGVAPRPWELLRARAETPWGQLDVINALVATGMRNPWDKVKTCDALATTLASAPRRPRLVAGDLGLPKREGADGFCGFGVGSKGRGPLWEEAELALVGPAARHGLLDAFRAVHPFVDAPAEHSVRTDGAPRRFDHMLVSAELVPEEAEYRRDWSEGRGLSDHAPLLVSFRVRSEWSYEAVAPTGPTF